MIIKKLDIENFGKFSGRSINLKPGFNLVFGKNEDGKSTIMSFVKMLFYGNSSGKTTDLSKNIRKKYLPWNGLPMSGAAEFEINGEALRLHKEFLKSSSSDKTTVINLENGDKYIVPSSEEPGHHFFGMDLGEFERSVFIENYGGFSSVASADSLAMRISNLSVSGNESFSHSIVQQRINSAIEELISKNGKKGLLVEEKLKLEQLEEQENKLNRHKESQFFITTEINRIKEEISHLETQLESHSEEQKIAIAKKSLTSFNFLMKKYNEQLRFKNNLLEYGLSESELRNIINQGITLQKDIERSSSSASHHKSELIPYDELNKLLEMEKQLSALNTDSEHISGIIHRTHNLLTETKIQIRKKYSLFSHTFLGVSGLSVLGAIMGYLLSLPLTASLLGIVLFIICLTASIIFGNKRNKIENNIEVRLANQEYSNALRLLSFYSEESTQKTYEQLTHECEHKKENISQEINNILSRYNCSSSDELKSKALSANNRLQSSVNEHENNLRTEFIQLVSAIGTVNSFEQADILFSQLKDTVRKHDEIQHDIETISKATVHGKISPDFVREQIDVLNKIIENSKITHPVSDINPEQLNNELKQKRQLLGDLQSRLIPDETDENCLKAQITNAKKKINEYTSRYSSLLIASKALDSAISDMSKGLGFHLNQKTGQYLEMMSDGKYKDVLISRDLNVETRTDSTQAFHQWKHLSSGAADRVYLALRLAATDIIAENHNPLPLFLDDILAQYDDESCENTLKFLKKYLTESGSVSQILFFTCHNHIAKMAKNIFTDLNEITL